MIPEFVAAWEQNKDKVRAQFASQHPGSYIDIVKIVVQNMPEDVMDADRIHKIDDGDYQGTLLFVIGADGYQPSQYWAVKVGYGSCSGCDTLQSIMDSSYSDDDNDGKPTESQVNDYMTLALHIVQGLKEI